MLASEPMDVCHIKGAAYVLRALFDWRFDETQVIAQRRQCPFHMLQGRHDIQGCVDGLTTLTGSR